MKILFFEDREEDIQGIVDYCVDQGYDYFHDKFVEGSLKIEEYNPDIIIVDLKNSQDNFEGCNILEKIWGIVSVQLVFFQVKSMNQRLKKNVSLRL